MALIKRLNSPGGGRGSPGSFPGADPPDAESQSAAAASTQTSRCRANLAHARQSNPDFGLGFQAKALFLGAVPSSLGSSKAGITCGPLLDIVRAPIERAWRRSWVP